MIAIRKLLNSKYSQLFHNRNSIMLTKKEKTENGILYEFQVPSLTSNNVYTAIILVSKENYDADTNCSVRCNCPSFKFQYMTRLFRYKGLYGDNPDVNVLPKTKKPIVTGCKHLAIAAHELIFNHAKYKL